VDLIARGWIHIGEPFGDGAARQRPHELRGAPQGCGREFWVDTPAETLRRLAGNLERRRCAADADVVEIRCLKQHMARGVRDLALQAAHDARDADRPAAIGDHQHVGAERMVRAVERGHALALGGAADDDSRWLTGLPRSQPVIVKGMQRLAQLEHHIVGDVDHVADGALTCQPQAALHPERRGANGDVADQCGTIARAEVRVGDLDLNLALNGRARGLHLDGGGVERPACQRRYFAGHPEDREAAGQIGRQIDLQHRVPEIVDKGHAHGSVIGKQHDAGVLVGDLELELGANHARGFHATDPGALEFAVFDALGVPVAQRHPLHGKDDLLA